MARTTEGLAAIFCAALYPDAAKPASSKEVEAFLEKTFSAARESWPQVDVPATRFLPFLADRLNRDLDLLKALEQLRTSDLYLTCACAELNREALALFDRRYLTEVDRVLWRSSGSEISADDVKQALREKLFVASPGARPKIAEYSGRGSLAGWLQVTVVRLVVDLARDRRLSGGEPWPASAAFFEAPPMTDPELEYMRRRYRAEFKAAFEAAAGSLTPRQRNLLRHQLVYGLTVNEIAPLYRIHRATAARWLDKARTTLLKSTRREFARRTSLEGDDFQSVMRLIQSQLDVSLQRILGSDLESAQ